jgi:hypothetical protein
MARARAALNLENGPAARRQSEVVYFVQSAALGFVKIGIAANVLRRLGALQSSCPDKLNLLGVIRPFGALSLERRLHEIFAHERHHGEWFNPCPDLMAYIEESAISAEADAADPNPVWTKVPGSVQRRERPVVRAPSPGRAGSHKAALSEYKAARGIR